MMITIQSGKLMIPDADRFIGFAGDNLSCTKTFVIPDRVRDNSEYTLYLRFDDGSVRAIPLSASQNGSDIHLTWNVSAAHLLKPGVVTAQVKTVDSDDVVTHTTRDYFLAADSAQNAGGDDSVTRSELEEMLHTVSGKLPYIGEDGYWYIYDPTMGQFERGAYVGGINVDTAMSDESAAPVQNCTIKAYIDAVDDAKVDKTVTVAGCELSSNISRAELAENIAGRINPPLVVPGVTSGYGGQYGKTALDGEPVMCRNMTDWITLAKKTEVDQKMALAPSVNAGDIAALSTGQLFIYQSSIALKTADGYAELLRNADVYSKAQIDDMIGDLEAALATL